MQKKVCSLKTILLSNSLSLGFLFKASICFRDCRRCSCVRLGCYCRLANHFVSLLHLRNTEMQKCRNAEIQKYKQYGFMLCAFQIGTRSCVETPCNNYINIQSLCVCLCSREYRYSDGLPCKCIDRIYAQTSQTIRTTCYQLINPQQQSLMASALRDSPWERKNALNGFYGQKVRGQKAKKKKLKTTRKRQRTLQNPGDLQWACWWLKISIKY